MTTEEIRSKKNLLMAQMKRRTRSMDILRNEMQNELLAVEEKYRKKRKPVKDDLDKIIEQFKLLQKKCEYHRLYGFYGTCPDCDYYVADTRRDGLRAHP